MKNKIKLHDKTNLKTNTKSDGKQMFPINDLYHILACDCPATELIRKTWAEILDSSAGKKQKK